MPAQMKNHSQWRRHLKKKISFMHEPKQSREREKYCIYFACLGGQLVILVSYLEVLKVPMASKNMAR